MSKPPHHSVCASSARTCTRCRCPHPNALAVTGCGASIATMHFRLRCCVSMLLAGPLPLPRAAQPSVHPVSRERCSARPDCGAFLVHLKRSCFVTTARLACRAPCYTCLIASMASMSHAISVYYSSTSSPRPRMTRMMMWMSGRRAGMGRLCMATEARGASRTQLLCGGWIWAHTRTRNCGGWLLQVAFFYDLCRGQLCPSRPYGRIYRWGSGAHGEVAGQGAGLSTTMQPMGARGNVFVGLLPGSTIGGPPSRVGAGGHSLLLQVLGRLLSEWWHRQAH
jgi:hypothetical protein